MTRQAERAKEGLAEKGTRFMRNVHLVGGLALLGAGMLLPPIALAANTAAAWQGLHAGAWEAGRQHFARKAKARRSRS